MMENTFHYKKKPLCNGEQSICMLYKYFYTEEVIHVIDNLVS